MSAIAWLLLTYKVPPEPAARRIAIWRRLKGMGAIYLQNGVCLLPKTDDHVRRLKMLENDVAEAKGESVILETVALDKGQEEKVIARFKADRDDAYEEFIDKRSEEHTSELQSLMRISYAVFCLKKKTKEKQEKNTSQKQSKKINQH